MRIALVAAGAVCLGSIPFLPARATDALGSELGSYALAAAAPGVELKLGEPTYCFTTPAGLNGCQGAVPEVTSQLQNGPIGSATAAIVWPGSLAANAGSLIITAGGSQVPPEATMLNDPVVAQAKTGDTPDTVTYDQVPNATMKAVAKTLKTSADGALEDFSASGIGTFGSLAGSTDTSVTGPRLVRSNASSQVSDITLAGVVHIGGVTSHAVATSDGVTAKVTGSTTVTGATIAGFPVTIDERGITVQGTGLALTTATAAVNQAVAAAGLTLLVSEPQGKPVGSDVTYTSGSLVAVFKPNADYLISVTMGGANVIASASPAYAGFVPAPPSGGTTGGVTVPGSTTGRTIVAGTPGTGGGPLAPGGSGAGPPPLVGGETPRGSAVDPVLAAQHARLGSSGLSPGLVVLALLGTGLVLAGMRRLPDRLLEATAPVCPLEEDHDHR